MLAGALARGQTPEALACQLHDLVVAQRPGGAEHEISTAVEARVVLLEILHRQGAHRLRRAGDLERERVVWPEGALGEVVEVDVLSVLVDLVEHLLEDDLPLQLHLLEKRVPDHVGEDAHAHGEAALVQRGEVEGVVAAGVAVQVPPDVLDGPIHGHAVGKGRAAAKEHVLEEVADAALLRRLVARAGAHVERQQGGVQIGAVPTETTRGRPFSRKSLFVWTRMLAFGGSIDRRCFQGEDKGGAALAAPLAAQIAAVLLGDALAEREAEAGAAGLGGIERIEEVGLGLDGDAGPLILDLDAHLLFAGAIDDLGARAQGEQSAGGRHGLLGVAHQIE